MSEVALSLIISIVQCYILCCVEHLRIKQKQKNADLITCQGPRSLFVTLANGCQRRTQNIGQTMSINL